MLDGAGSVALDIVKGGRWLVRDNLFQSGPNRESSNMATLATSKRRARGGVWNPELHDTRFQNNTWVLDGEKERGCILKGRSPGTITFDGDRLVGLGASCTKDSDALGINIPWADVSAPRPALKDGEPVIETATVTGVSRFETRAEAGLVPYLDQVRYADREWPIGGN